MHSWLEGDDMSNVDEVIKVKGLLLKHEEIMLNSSFPSPSSLSLSSLLPVLLFQCDSIPSTSHDA